MGSSTTTTSSPRSINLRYSRMLLVARGKCYPFKKKRKIFEPRRIREWNICFRVQQFARYFSILKNNHPIDRFPKNPSKIPLLFIQTKARSPPAKSMSQINSIQNLNNRILHPPSKRSLSSIPGFAASFMRRESRAPCNYPE